MTTDDLGLAHELLPCPFCGTQPTCAGSADDLTIMCGNDGCRLVVGVPATTKERAVKHWNDRLRSPRAVPANGAGREALIEPKGAELLSAIVDYFATSDERPGNDWAHPDDFSSYCLDHQSRDGTKFWLDLEKDGTIMVLWKPSGAKQAIAQHFYALASSPVVGPSALPRPERGCP